MRAATCGPVWVDAQSPVREPAEQLDNAHRRRQALAADVGSVPRRVVFDYRHALFPGPTECMILGAGAAERQRLAPFAAQFPKVNPDSTVEQSSNGLK